MTTELLFITAVVIVLGIAFTMLARRKSTAPAEQPLSVADVDDGVVGEPVPVITARPSTSANVRIDEPRRANDRSNSWVAQFESRGGLDVASRRKLIDDLGMLRAPWCVSILQQAVAEETDAANRAAAEAALERCQAAVGSG